jgi:hypothetical protein
LFFEGKGVIDDSLSPPGFDESVERVDEEVSLGEQIDSDLLVTGLLGLLLLEQSDFRDKLKDLWVGAHHPPHHLASDHCNQSTAHLYLLEELVDLGLLVLSL